MAKSPLANVIKGVSEPAPKPTATAQVETKTSTQTAGAKAREGKVFVGGYYSKDLSKALKNMATNEETTVQALIGEAIDMLLRERGVHPFGER